MNVDVTEYFAFVGAIITAIAYIPQIVHLVRKHCAFGISIRAWVCWLIAALLILPHAWVMKSAVFIALQLISILAITFTIVFASFHQEKECSQHTHRML